MQYSSTNTAIQGIFLLSSLLSPAFAELLSCADVGCPTVVGDTSCSVNGTQLADLGVSNISTPLSPEPLSWTVGYVNGANDSHDRREFYLGTPPDLDLNNVSSVSGCALLFTGEGYNPLDSPTSGNCADYLGSTCTSDLLHRAQVYTDLLKTNGTFQCNTLVQMLENEYPTSCLLPKWANVIGQDLTGPKAPPKLQLNQCHPTVNKTFDLRSVGSFTGITRDFFYYAITPVMTVFTPTQNSTGNVAGSVLNGTQVDLRCMRPMANKGSNQPVQAGFSGSASKELPSLSLGWTVVVAFFLLVLL